MKVKFQLVSLVIEQFGEFAFVPFGVWYSSTANELCIQPCPCLRVIISFNEPNP